MKNEKSEEKGALHLFLDEEEKNQKPRLIVRNEGGYIRKYVVKPNGDEILVMETKQTEAQKEMQLAETGDLIDIGHDQLMKQLEQASNLIKQEKQSKAAWEKESGITKYKTGI